MIIKINSFNEYITFCGRTYEAENATFFDWSCSGFEVSFFGTCLSAELRSEYGEDTYIPYVGVYTDGRPTGKLAVTRTCGELALADGLSAGRHTVRLVNLSEAQCCRCGIVSARTDGSFIPAEKKARRGIEFIGDSITCGFGNLGSLDIPYSTAVSDATQTYASLAAQAVGADFNITGISGIAVTDYPGIRQSIIGKYCYTQPFACEQRWDFSKFTADIVVINLGTNDGLTTESETYEGALELLRLVRLHNPLSRIIWAHGMMGDVKGDAVRQAIAEFNAEDKNAEYLPLPPQNIDADGTGSAYHPNLISHKKSADVLAARLRQLL